ncbi:MAG: DUF4389 domain-containing protein [Gammaproteobacteria bacterium]|nr:DUF4389 domain-containing protein [Gammaproteobacteria bacterium]
MDDDLRQNMTASETWLRGLFMLLFVFLLVVARVVTGAVVVIQFLFTVFTGQCNDNLREFGASLAMYVYQALLFVTYNSESKPFPFAPWPSRDVDAKFVAEAAAEPVGDTPADALDVDEQGEHELR